MPGLREVQLWGDAEGADQAFPEIASLAESCRFRDCRHQGEPSCAVAGAVEMEEMGEGHLQNYHKLQRELAYLATKQDEGAVLEQKRKWKQIQKTYRRTHGSKR